MTDNRKASLALSLGSVGGIVTMAIHPTMATATNHLALLSQLAHSLALISILLLFLGALQLARALNAPDRLALVAIVTFAFATVAIMIAATVSGFIFPGILQAMARDEPGAAPQWRICMGAIFQFNQAFSRLYSVGAATAITLWSIAALRARSLSQGVAIYGCLSAPLITLLICVGHLRLNVHGMAVVMVSQVIWFVGMALALRRLDSLSPAGLKN